MHENLDEITVIHSSSTTRIVDIYRTIFKEPTNSSYRKKRNFNDIIRIASTQKGSVSDLRLMSNYALTKPFEHAGDQSTDYLTWY